MEFFRRAVKKRLALMGGFNALAIVLIVLTGAYKDKSAVGSEYISGMIYGFQIGIFIGLQLMALIHIIKYMKALKSQDALKKLYIGENDERRKLIRDKIGGAGFNIIIVVIGAAAVIAGFLNQLAFLTLLGVLVFIVTVKGSLKIYYRNKF